MKQFVIIAFVIFASGRYSFAGNVAPSDSPTIEALIELHKSMKKDARLQQSNLVMAAGTQSGIKDWSDKINQAKTTLNSKIKDWTAWAYLALPFANMVTDMYSLIDETADFNKRVFKNIEKYPFVVHYYADACSQLGGGIKYMKKVFAKISSNNMNIFKANMKERINMIYMMQGSISRCRHIIHKADFNCRIYMNPGVKTYLFQEIINSNVLKQSADAIIVKWG